MKLIKDDVLFIVKHMDCIFAPETPRWVEDWHHEPAIKTNLVRACKENMPPEYWARILTSYPNPDKESPLTKKLGVHLRPSIVRRAFSEEDLHEYEFRWGEYKEVHLLPKYTLPGTPIPEYLQSFRIEDERIRQCFETKSGCTWAALAGFKLWEIDKE